jgi:hypothetical protein
MPYLERSPDKAGVFFAFLLQLHAGMRVKKVDNIDGKSWYNPGGSILRISP